MVEPLLETGELLAGKYRIEELLGRGGMGEVYLATNTSIDRRVAIKVLRAEDRDKRRLLARFRQEAKTAGRLHHPGIVEILDLSETIAGQPFIVMEYLHGETLAERVQRSGPLNVDEAAALADAVLVAVGAAHDKGVLHRDLKPANVFLVGGDARTPKLLDFGLAKLRDDEDVELSATGEVLGTPLYMAPEQARGIKPLTNAADLYGVGGIVHYSLAGTPPFTGSTYSAVLSAVLTDEPPSVAAMRDDVSGPLAELVRSLLAKDPGDRPASCRAARLQLRRVVPDAELPAVEPGPEELSVEDTVAAPRSIALDETMHSSEAEGDPPRKVLGGLLWPLAGAAVVVAIAVGLLIHRATSSDTSSSPNNPGATPAPPSAEQRTLRIGVQDPPGTLNPYAVVGTPAEFVLDHVIERLVTLDRDGKPVPGPVASWQANAAGTSVTIRLRDDVRFHDHPCFAGGTGRLAKPADVVYSIELAVRSGTFELPIAGIEGFRDNKKPTIAGLSVRGGAVVARLSHPSPFVGAWLSMARLLPAELRNCKQDDVSNMKRPVGSGPFQFARAVTGDQLQIERFAGYWGRGDASKLVSRVTVVVEPSPQEGMTRLRNGSLDMLLLLPGRTAGVIDDATPSQPRLAERYRSVPARVGVTTELNYAQVKAVLRVVGKKGPLYDQHIARAVALGVDRAAAVRGDPRGLVPLGRPFPPQLRGRNPSWSGFSRDVAAAKKLLALCNHPAARGKVAIVIGAKPKDAPIARRLSTQLAPLGLRVDVREMSGVELGRALSEKRVDALFAGYGWHVMGSEPYPFGVSFLHLAHSAGESRPRQRALADRIERELDRRKRFALYEQLELAVRDAYDLIPIAYPPPGSPEYIIVIGKQVAGVIDEISGRLLHPGFEFLRYARIAPKTPAK